VRILYVSPLKALNNDIHRNLEAPLAGIHAEASRRGVSLPPLRTAVRTELERCGMEFVKFCKNGSSPIFYARYPGAILGFVTVAAAWIETSAVPAAQRRELPSYPLPVLRLARLEEFEALVKLLRTGARMDEVLALIETPQDLSERVACLKAASRATIYKLDEIYVAFSRVHSHEAAACRGLIKLGADIAVVAAEKRDEIRISSRGRQSMAGLVDLAEIFKGLGEIIGGTGGGHDLAGSANGSDAKSRDSAFRYILKALEERTGKKASKLE
jgi:hypothetical protein